MQLAVIAIGIAEAQNGAPQFKRLPKTFLRPPLGVLRFPKVLSLQLMIDPGPLPFLSRHLPHDVPSYAGIGCQGATK